MNPAKNTIAAAETSSSHKATRKTSDIDECTHLNMLANSPRSVSDK